MYDKIHYKLKKKKRERQKKRKKKSWLTGKDSDAGKDWGQEEKGGTEDEMVGWHHQLDGHEFEQTPGDSEVKGKPGMLQSMSSQSQTQFTNWTTNLNISYLCLLVYKQLLMELGMGKPGAKSCAAIFLHRTLKIPRILNFNALTQPLWRYICQSRRIEHILVNNLLL